jgi:hypothetical protein
MAALHLYKLSVNDCRLSKLLLQASDLDLELVSLSFDDEIALLFLSLDDLLQLNHLEGDALVLRLVLGDFLLLLEHEGIEVS